MVLLSGCRPRHRTTATFVGRGCCKNMRPGDVETGARRARNGSELGSRHFRLSGTQRRSNCDDSIARLGYYAKFATSSGSCCARIICSNTASYIIFQGLQTTLPGALRTEHKAYRQDLDRDASAGIEDGGAQAGSGLAEIASMEHNADDHQEVMMSAGPASGQGRNAQQEAMARQAVFVPGQEYRRCHFHLPPTTSPPRRR